MAKGNLPNNNTQATSNSVGLNKMENTGNQAPWQQMANANVSYPSSIVQQGGLGPSSTNVFGMNQPMAFGGPQASQNGFFNRLMPGMQGSMPQQNRAFQGPPIGTATPRVDIGMGSNGGLMPSMPDSGRQTTGQGIDESMSNYGGFGSNQGLPSYLRNVMSSPIPSDYQPSKAGDMVSNGWGGMKPYDPNFTGIS